MSLPKIQLYNTLSRSVVELKTITPGAVKLYCCGPTVYHFQHIGNLRTYLFEDLLVRTLRGAGYGVDHVMNITDVGHLVGDGDTGEDKMAVAAKREKKKSDEIAAYYSGIFFDDCAKLNIVRPNTVCQATEHVQEMIELIKRLEAKGYTYQSGGNVYFDIAKCPDYGKLAKLDVSKLEAGARIEVDSKKKSPLDFALWFTKSKFEGQEHQWDSPWGKGYPGWHIECSAMSIKYLGEQFDIHCGGIDHIPVHHTNEIAQSECATGKPWVTIWMHGGFLVNEKSEKMAKSSGGFTCLKDLIDRGIDPMAYRFLCLGTHYRKELAFGWDALSGAVQSLEKLKKGVLALKAEAKAGANVSLTAAGSAYVNQFNDAVRNDINTPQGLAVVWSVLADKALPAAERFAVLSKLDEILGLGLKDWKEEAILVPEAVLELVAAREAARKAKDWKRSDELRDQIKALGYAVEDAGGGGKVRKI